jgi:hypothetical protein
MAWAKFPGRICRMPVRGFADEKSGANPEREIVREFVVSTPSERMT